MIKDEELKKLLKQQKDIKHIYDTYVKNDGDIKKRIKEIIQKKKIEEDCFLDVNNYKIKISMIERKVYNIPPEIKEAYEGRDKIVQIKYF